MKKNVYLVLYRIEHFDTFIPKIRERHWPSIMLTSGQSRKKESDPISLVTPVSSVIFSRCNYLLLVCSC